MEVRGRGEMEVESSEKTEYRAGGRKIRDRREFVIRNRGDRSEEDFKEGERVVSVRRERMGVRVEDRV